MMLERRCMDDVKTLYRRNIVVLTSGRLGLHLVVNPPYLIEYTVVCLYGLSIRYK